MSEARLECPPARPFSALRPEAHDWITVYPAEFYPDRLDAAIDRYEPVLERFDDLSGSADSSAALLRLIMAEPKALRGDLLKVFVRYVSPNTKTELLRRKCDTEEIIERLGGEWFRPLETVREKLRSRPRVDEALIAILAEHSNRGQSGYKLTEDFFRWFEAEFGDTGWTIDGPKAAGRDINLPDVLAGFKKRMPVDIVIRNPSGELRAIGFARYDTDRGGAQEDDRIGGNVDKLTEIAKFNAEHSPPIKLLYVNDGLGLILGSMWRDYSAIETVGNGVALVTTLKMAQAGRVSLAWLDS